jgi:hypothetical protein
MHDKKTSSLSDLSDQDLSKCFEQRNNDFGFLEELDRELKQRDSDAALELHMRVARRRISLRREISTSDPVRQWLNSFLNARGLKTPDGRPIYRYRMRDGEYDAVKKILRNLVITGRLVHPDMLIAALFVVYCAEWFRRESASTFLRWDDPAPDLFPSIPYANKQALAAAGLDFWRRILRKSEFARQFLLTVALEGGFPVQILAEGARGWLKDYLRAVMRRSIALRSDTQDEIHSIAQEERGRMRKGYQHDDFIALCSELVASLLHLRQKAEAESAGGVRNSALLDAKHPEWREELPIYVPPKDEALVFELLSGLLDDKMTGLVTAGVEARRYLVKRDGVWMPAIQLLADGEVPMTKLPGLVPTQRVRAIATGELGNHLAGEVALFEPPLGEQRRWRVHPYMRTAKLLTGFSFEAAVTVALSASDQSPYIWTWPRGEALRSDVLVFEPDESTTSQEFLLRFYRSGSVSSPAKTLYVLVPLNWSVEPVVEGTVIEEERIQALGGKLVRLSSAAYFHSGENEALRFRVEPDAEGREQELELLPLTGSNFSLADDRKELVASPAHPLIREGRKQPRPPGPGELFLRRLGGRWVPHAGPLNGVGLMELSWRDPVANIQLEKRLLALMPSGASVIGIMKDDLAGKIILHGLPGWTATISKTICKVESVVGNELSFRFTGRPVYRLPMTLRPPAGQEFDVIVPLIGRDAVIALADGGILAPGRQIDVGTLRGAVVIAPGRTVIHLTSMGTKSGGIKMPVDGELPLGILRGAIDETLATLSSQDDLVQIDFIGDSRRPIRISRYRNDQIAQDGDELRWSPLSCPTTVKPVSKMILDPRHEYALEPNGEGTWRVSAQCKGPCLVYLRDGVDVLSRPMPLIQPDIPKVYDGVLVSAMLVPTFHERQRVVADALARLGRGNYVAGDLSWLRDAVMNLNGLPASAFDVLKLLPSSPETLVHLLLSARDTGERSIIWALQNELPFLWLALPLRAWWSAIEAQSMVLANTIASVLGREKARIEVSAWLRGICADLKAIEPAMNEVFSMVGIASGTASVSPSLSSLINRYIQEQHLRGGETQNEFGARLASVGLRVPPEINEKSHIYFAGLFAPVLLAASAHEKLVLDREQALLVRRALREDPDYVSGAWPHFLKFYNRG